MKTFCLLLLLCSVANRLDAQVPRTLSYQGVLTDTLGNPRPDGAVTITFRLYETSSGGNPVWTEVKDLQIRRGLFSTLLGDVTGFSSGVHFDRPYWLGVKPGSDPELSPRVPLSSVGYSFTALKADTAAFARNAPVQASVDSARVAGTVTNNSITSAKIADGAIQRADVAGTFKAPYADTADAARSSAPTGTAGGDLSGTYPDPILADNPASLHKVSGGIMTALSGKIGIGTTTPAEQLEITGNLGLPLTTATAGIIYRGTETYIHSYGDLNFFAGPGSGNLTTTGSGNSGVGSSSLIQNTTGSDNTASGSKALFKNTSGTRNTACGVDALYLNTSGSYNTAIGAFALLTTTTSLYNTAVGYGAGDSWNNGYNNVFVGADTDVNAGDLFNVIAIGQGTIVTSSSTARFGNAATTSYGGWAGWSNVSDGRFKKNVRENVPGLEFITRLRPITYNLDATAMDAFLHRNEPAPVKTTPQGLSAAEAAQTAPQALSAQARAVHEQALRAKEQILYTGFAAQEVEAAARELGFDFSGVDAPKNANDYYGLRYADFVVPLVKAVQELANQNLQQEKMIQELQKEIDLLKRGR